MLVLAADAHGGGPLGGRQAVLVGLRDEVHVGFALARIDEDEARATITLLESLGAG